MRKMDVGYNVHHGQTTNTQMPEMQTPMDSQNREAAQVPAMYEEAEMKANDLTGRTFGSLVAVSKLPPFRTATGVPMTAWNCVCACGNRKKIRTIALLTGKTKTCGSQSCPSWIELHASRMAPSESGRNNLWALYKIRAIKKGLDFDLSKDQLGAIAASDCCYCGAKPSLKIVRWGAKSTFIYNGIDRIDSAGGYVIGNVQPCCMTCNKMKSSMPDAAFKAHIRRMYEVLSRSKALLY